MGIRQIIQRHTKVFVYSYLFQCVSKRALKGAGYVVMTPKTMGTSLLGINNVFLIDTVCDAFVMICSWILNTCPLGFSFYIH